jgi:xanthine dehydrogenase molybdopterin-binding subunit B
MNPRDPKKSPSPEASGESADRIRVGVGSVSREIEPGSPAGDAPAWSLDTQHRLLEKKHTRLDGPEKASGRAKYPTDIAVPGMLHAVILRSTIAHGRVEAIDTSAAEKLPGVRGIEVRTGPGRQVRHLGQEILAIAAETEQQAKDACDVVLVQYQRQEHEVAPEDEVRARETAEAQSFPRPAERDGQGQQ